MSGFIIILLIIGIIAFTVGCLDIINDVNDIVRGYDDEN